MMPRRGNSTTGMREVAEMGRSSNNLTPELRCDSEERRILTSRSPSARGHRGIATQSLARGLEEVRGGQGTGTLGSLSM